MISRTLAHYKILEKIGEGGMGEVWKARDTTLNRDVALKILPEAFAADSTRLTRFQVEARAAARLSHPGIVTLYSLEEHGGIHFLTMELIEGVVLDSVLPEQGMSLDSLLDITIPLADALAYAHEKGVVHRDLKLSNVIRDKAGRVRILDFGVAALLAPDTEALDKAATIADPTSPGGILGTVATMAPEQLEGRPADSRMDLFAFGVLLYHLATGDAPFRGQSTSAIASSILRDQPPSVTVPRPDLPEDLGRIIRRCLEKDPERRFQTAKDVRNELEDIRLYPMAVSSAGRGLKDKNREGRFTLTPDYVRVLTDRIPRMIGDALEYVDNGVGSDTLVIFLHGAGGDHREFLPVLSGMTCRGVAVSLFGFGPSARFRPALSLEDHHRLLRMFLEDLDQRLRPRNRILVGKSSGADQWLRMLASTEGVGFEPDALLLLSPNVGLQSAFVTRVFAEMTDDPADILGTFKSLGENVDSLRKWLNMQDYLVRTLWKFGNDMAVLRRFGADIVAPFHNDPEAHYAWFQNAMDRVPQVRFVFAEEEVAEAETVIARHLDTHVLGDRFTEKTIQFAAVPHIELSAPEVTLPHLKDLMGSLQH